MRKTSLRTAVTLLLPITAAAQTLPELEKKADSVYWPGETWEHVTPKEAGLDAKKLGAIADFVLSRNSTSFVVVRGGRIVIEKYAAGGGKDVKRRIASATKSMTSILVGIALDAGKFEGLDQAVAERIASPRHLSEHCPD